jgi:hypothetical protein
LAVSVTTPQTNTSNTFTANQIISVTDNTNAALRITQLGTGEAIRVEDSTNPDSTAFVVDSNGAVSTGNGISCTALSVTGGISLPASTTETRNIELGTGRTGNGNTYIDFTGDATYTDYGLRIIRGAGGANTSSQIAHRGTGPLTLTAQDAGSIDFYTNGTQRINIRSDGNIGMGGGGLANVTLNLAKALTGSTTVTALFANGAIQPDATGSDNYFATTSATAANGATPYTISAINHYNAIQGTFNADSTVSNQVGFNSSASLIGATNNYGFNAANTAAVTTGKTAYGFYSGINTATGGGTTYGFFAAGTANNVMPNLSGGTAASSTLTLQSTTGAGTTDAIIFKTASQSERFRIGTAGQLGIGGTNYGTSGQTIISGGSAAAPSWGTLGVAGGGTGATTANAGLTNLTTLTSTATAAGTTTLTNTSTYFQLFTGTTTQTVVLPVTSTLATGWTFHIINNSTGNLTVNSSGGNLVVTVIPGTTAMVTCIGTTLTTAADWEAGLTDFSTYTGTGSVVLANDPVFSTGIRIGTGGTLGAGSIYSNANWGMLFQAKQASPALGDYALLNSAGTIRMAINASGALGVGSTPSYGTSGQALISGGTGAAPAWGTLGVSGGGTGVTSATAYALLAGGTTSTGAFQSLGTGTSGQVLTSGGASALPTWTSLTTGAVYIAGGIVTSSASLSFTNISTYSKLLLITSHSTTSTSARTLNVALSSNNGTSYGTANAFTVNAISTTSVAAQTIAEISNTGSSGTSKTITGYSSGMNNNAATVTATDAVTTGVINAIQITCSNTATSGFVALWGIP